AVPTARMSYSAGAFTQPLVDVFGFFLRPFRHVPELPGLFPPASTHVVKIEDVSRERLLRPVFQTVGHVLGKLRWLQEGRLQIYVLYITLTLLVLMGWNLW
ncbi:MAG TPA: hydrogenase, partial [Candidatus Ozemobacteraceae bacterium]|nr:hydrogenase [Candidatus Ozemobacteraceae bacterium]